MSVDLTKVLSWKHANADEVDMLDDLQGNILKGHGRDHTSNLFLVFDQNQPIKIKTFIHNLAIRIKTAHQQLKESDARKKRVIGAADGGVFVSFLLSAAGYDALGIPNAKIPQNTAFLNGLKSRQEILADPDFGLWEDTFQNQIHAMVLIGDDHLANVEKEREIIINLMPDSVSVVGEENGMAIRNDNNDGIEHFGYVDGRSQPLMLKEDIQFEGGIHIWDPTFPIGQALVRCPGGTSANSHGSYFVFRKLEQDVKGFKEAEEAIAKQLELEKHGEDPELAGAMLVGRFEDGTPVVMQKTDKLLPVPNNFDFRDDSTGSKCPFHSHIRKVNPRGESQNLGASLEQERSHIMARRGIPYGGLPVNLDKPINRKVGLLFMAYQNDIENQFEFTQQSWANDSEFVKTATGIDPVIGQGEGASTPLQQSAKWGDPDSKQNICFNGFVTMKGGEYFFAPSISFLKTI